MEIFHAVILAIIEGLTEFLPVSSTGHMIIGSSLMGIAADPFTKMFTVAIQLGAILSVIVLYWKRFFQSIDFYVKLFLAFLPAAIIGYLFNDYIDRMLERVDIVAYMLIAGGIIFLFVDKVFEENEKKDKAINHFTAIRIGFFQVIAMIPGVSRSAATIIGGLSQGLNKKTAAEFSFFLAVPTMFAATLYKVYKYFDSGATFGSSEITLLVIGNIVAFIVALLAIRSFISFLTKHGFKVFGYYRIILGIILLILLYSGVELSIV
jgi:undecaprenyl-diphosphatase